MSRAGSCFSSEREINLQRGFFLGVPGLDVAALRLKFRGSMLGTGVGDALGRPLEGGVFRLVVEQPEFDGRYTDDTEMMIGVAESLVEVGGFDGEHMARTFMRNYDPDLDRAVRRYGPGPPTVFRLIERGERWDAASRRLFGGEGSFGNGAAMRIAPVGLLYFDEPEALRKITEQSSLITHAHPLGVEGAVVQAYAVALAVKSKPPSLNPREFLEELEAFTREEVYREALREAALLLDERADRRKVVSALGNGVEAFRSVPTAIYCFAANAESFEKTVLYAISLGGDTDTIGAMAGAISGAYHGEEKIPSEWVRKLENADYIASLADRLLELKLKQQ
ncbi:MAG: ADP-ribosylglycohydrolase family protein [Candidatus Freyarchaeota archaeon]|nr:ADP-ribosylglycohydrolase family protein [Candidatus Jordarchaeia archaeon]